MSSDQPPATPRYHNPVFDELRWVIHIRDSLENEVEDDQGIPVSIFDVPKGLQSTKVEAYTPQLIALGPYHHWHPGLYDMERYKLSAAKRTQKQFHNLKLQHLVDQFAKVEHNIRAHYHRYLDFNRETLSWMMAVDASFLLEFLQVCSIKEGNISRMTSARMSHLMDYTGKKLAHNVILRDIMMLENQIPVFLLRKILELQCPSIQEADDTLTRMLMGFLKHICPFKIKENFPSLDVTQHAHLLELLYYILVPISEEQFDNNEIEEQNDETATPTAETLGNCGYVGQLFDVIWKCGSSIDGAVVNSIRNIIFSRPVTFIMKLPWKILTSLPGFSILKQPVEYLFSQGGSSKTQESSSTKNINKIPLVEEIMIPSVNELIDAGVRFSPTNGDLTTINFDVKTVTLYLPIVTLDINTEVILRNLVAYEASAASGPLVFARYTELMNGIIDTAEDVKLLREKGIVRNRMKSDEKGANLWNAMNRSIRLTRVPYIDKVIEDVNKYYNSKWKVKAGKFMKKYVFSSWQILTFFAAILFLLLTALQAFCSVYTCSRWFGLISVGKQ